MSVHNENNPHTHHLSGSAVPTRLGISTALDDARKFIADAELDELARYQFLIVVEELMTNIITHGMPAPNTEIAYEFAYQGGAVRIDLSDSGIPFDPRDLPHFSPDAAIEQEREGGWGWPVIFKWFNLESYRRADGRNHVALLLKPL